MSEHIQKCPAGQSKGISHNIHPSKVNDKYFSMINTLPRCKMLVCEFLEKYEELLQRFEGVDPRAFRGNELDAFIALVNLERSLDNNGGLL